LTAKARITRAAGAVSAATLISRVLGYVKDMILARYFGATGISDVFFVAFRIPNLLRELFAEGSMSSAFIPVLTEYQTMQGREEANRLVRSTFLFILIVVGQSVWPEWPLPPSLSRSLRRALETTLASSRHGVADEDHVPLPSAHQPRCLVMVP